MPASETFHPSSRTERREPKASGAPIRDLVRQGSDSPDEVPDSLALGPVGRGSASGMTGGRNSSLA
jgi:hypothetical protein